MDHYTVQALDTHYVFAHPRGVGKTLAMYNTSSGSWVSSNAGKAAKVSYPHNYPLSPKV